MEDTQEVWKVIKDFPKYEVSTFGNVRHIKKQRILTGYIRDGYKKVPLRVDNTSQKTMLIHRLVAITFIPNPENKSTVNHKNHDSLNNNIENLEWFSVKEQNQHKRKCDKKIKELVSSRKVWRVDIITGEKLQLYNTVRQAAKWVFDNGLTILTDFSKFKSKISEVAQGNKKQAHGYRWIYEQEENLTNEIWKPIPKTLVNGVEGFFISSLGRIKNQKGRISSGYKQPSGYLWVSVNQKQYLLHRLVAQVFLENLENKKQVNHIDGNKLNSKVSNLEWCTNKENQIHKFNSGLGHTKSIIQYDLNMNKLNEFKSQTEASRKLNLKLGNISSCCNRKVKTVGGFIFRFKNDNNMNFIPRKLPTKVVIQFDLNMNQLAEFESIKTASSKLNINYSSIGACCRGKQKTAGGFIFNFKD